MSSGTMTVKQYNGKKYFSSRNFDKKFGGKFTFLLEPLNGNIGEKFFYIKDLKNGTFEVEGESYIFEGYSNDNYNEYLKKLSLKLKNKKIYYYHIDNNDNVLKGN